MRSRTSRGVPEWSGGKDLYMGSPVWGRRKCFGGHRYCTGTTGRVPEGPPGGATCLRGAYWAEYGWEPAHLSGLVRQPP